ncbi:hypothetical protein [uncultured Psychroserpens sp.]|uniref:hypothetical protein n=1 Tax=uncultured Psychroserpens sp. TaxID=255436 RepID=UPI00261CEDA7|nr:hypothetical protein [uncultured Psychroserpens sp.]
MNRKYFLVSFTLVLLASGFITFIYFSNDHTACETLTEITQGEQGETVKTETHVCKEKFNF